MVSWQSAHSDDRREAPRDCCRVSDTSVNLLTAGTRYVSHLCGSSVHHINQRLKLDVTPAPAILICGEQLVHP